MKKEFDFNSLKDTCHESTLIADNMLSYLSKILYDMEAKKEQVIIERLQIMGITIDIEEEKQRRFKRFITEIDDTTQRVYFNDGSKDGILVATFIINEPLTFKYY